MENDTMFLSMGDGRSYIKLDPIMPNFPNKIKKLSDELIERNAIIIMSFIIIVNDRKIILKFKSETYKKVF